jgi:hypothetical protein
MYSIEIKDKKEIYDFCMLNGITDINKFIQDCFKQGFDIKKYGLIGDNTEKIIEYVDKEIPIEVIKYVEKEVIKEVPIEVIKEVEKPNEKMGMIQETLMKLRREIGDKDKIITELNNKIEQLEKLVSNTGAVYLKGSNISQNL